MNVARRLEPSLRIHEVGSVGHHAMAAGVSTPVQGTVPRDHGASLADPHEHPAAKISAVLLTNTTLEGMDGKLRSELERAFHAEAGPPVP